MRKEKCQVLHAKRRALQRYNVALNNHSYGILVRQIQTGKSKPFGSQSLSRTLHLVTQEEEWGNKIKMLAVYDKRRGTIATFLPRNLIEQIEGKSREEIENLIVYSDAHEEVAV